MDYKKHTKQPQHNKNRYDIPVLHINDVYWAKHRLTSEDAIAGIIEALSGNFTSKRGEPDASRLEKW